MMRKYFGKFFSCEWASVSLLPLPIVFIYLFIRFNLFLSFYFTSTETLTLGIFIKSCPFVMLQTPIAFIFINVMWNE